MGIARTSLIPATLTFFLLAGAAPAQPRPIINPDFDGAVGQIPHGWTAGPEAALRQGYLVGVSDLDAQDGGSSVRLAWTDDQSPAARSAASLSQVVDARPLRGQRVRFRAAVRNARPTDAHVGLWMRVDRVSGEPGFFDNMSNRPIRSGDWTFYEVVGDVAADAVRLNVGFLVVGNGEAYFDSASLEVIGPAESEDEDNSPIAADHVVTWLSDHAQGLEAVEIGAPRADLSAFSTMVGDARIVSLGEATHGSREHFQIKGRLVEHLIESEGFTAFAIEASYADTLAVNRYVLMGEGDLNTVVAGMQFWTWSTEEVAELVDWIRTYNLSLPPDRRVRFYGFDAQAQQSPLRVALAYLARAGQPVAIEDVDFIASLLFDSGSMRGTGRNQTQPPELEDRAAFAARLLESFDARQEALVAATSTDDFAAHRQAVVAFRQAVEIAIGQRDRQAAPIRDRIMADNVDWILEQQGPDGRIVLWAHNGHVRQGTRGGEQTMGAFLEARHGDDHLTVGFMFDQGGFRAVGPDHPLPRAFAVGPERDTLDAIFASVERPLFYIDLRPAELDAPPVWDWLTEQHLTRWVGSHFYPDQPTASLVPIRIGEEFDIVIMTLSTTPALPLR